MEVTLGQIYASFSLLSRIVDQQLPIRLAFRFTKLIRSLNQEYQSLESLRDKLVKKHGEEVEDGNGAYRVGEEAKEGFIKEFQELLSTEVEVDWELISVDDVTDSLQFSIRELNNIGWLFIEFAELAAAAAEEQAAEVAEEEVTEVEDSEAEAVEAPEAEAAEVG